MRRDLLALAKPRIALTVALTAWVGWRVAGGAGAARLAWTLLGTALCAAASGAFNQLLETEQDARMSRTRARPLPGGRLRPGQAAAFGAACAAAGLAALAYGAGALPCALAAAAIGLYLVYTPLKRLTPQSTWFGAVSGAMPPLIGWAAARGRIEAGAWALFAIQFLWQIPHFLALFWLHREDYARAGFRVMPVVDRVEGHRTGLQIALHSLALFLAALLPALSGLASPAYGLAAVVIGAGFLALGLRASWTMARADARALFLGSLAYLPAIFGLLAAGV